MKEEKIFDAITGIRDDIIERAETHELCKKRRASWLKWGAIAACCCIAVGLGTKLVKDNIGGNAGGGGSESGSGYMSYEGPVLPLGSMTELAGVTAERGINFDFSPYKPFTESYEYDGEIRTYESYNSESIITDSYTLRNTTGEDITAQLVYSFVGGFRSRVNELPTITVGGEEVQTQLSVGKYIGGFTGVYGGNDDTERVNLLPLDNWTGYEALLSDSAYMQEAFNGYPELNQNIIVYKITDIAYNGNDEKATNPTLSLEFSHSVNTTVMTYGSTGGHFDPEGGWQHRSYNIPESFNPDYGEPKYLLVYGEDITDLTLQGYRDGGCDEGEEIEGVTAEIERYEAPLSEIIHDIFISEHSYLNPAHSEDAEIVDIVSDEMLMGCFADTLTDYGVLADDPAERYRWGSLIDIWSETLRVDRIMYLTFDVTIPAGGSIDVSATMSKEASIDFVGSHTDRNGYDMMTTLASNLDFTAQTASISSTDDIEIISQNFGFDIANGITEVKLDIAQPHYYLEVRKLKTE